jgi:hypothetical protein
MMSNFRNVLQVGLFVLSPGVVMGQIVCDLPDVKGVASIRGAKTYLAVWKQTRPFPVDTLDIYEGLQCKAESRVAHFEDKETSWQSLSAVEDSVVLGFRVRTEAGDGWFGWTKLFMFDGKKFYKAFESGETAEVIDLNGDGYPEVVEFLSGEGPPDGKARVWVWQKDRFVVLTTVGVSELYSQKLFSLLSGFAKKDAERRHP